MSSPTSRTLEFLRGKGYVPWVVEYFHAHAKKRVDAYGWMDILAYHVAQKKTLGVQACTISDMSTRLKKLQLNEDVIGWLRAGNEAWIFGWGLQGPAGKRKLYRGKIWLLHEAPDGVAVDEELRT